MSESLLEAKPPKDDFLIKYYPGIEKGVTL